MNMLSATVKSLRKQFNMTQEELSIKSGVGLRFVRDLEQGKPTLRLDKVNQLLEKNDKVTYSDHLHLAVSLRSYRAEKLSAFVQALLAIEPTAA